MIDALRQQEAERDAKAKAKEDGQKRAEEKRVTARQEAREAVEQLKEQLSSGSVALEKSAVEKELKVRHYILVKLYSAPFSSARCLHTPPPPPSPLPFLCSSQL